MVNIIEDYNNNVLYINLNIDIHNYGVVVGGVVEWWWGGGGVEQ